MGITWRRKKPAEPLAPQQSPYGVTMLLALNRTGKHIYEGTVDPVTVAKRRAANKVARRSRRINRGGR